MPKNKGIYRIFRTREEMERYDNYIKEMVYSRATFERELKMYTGGAYAPPEERY